MLRFGDFQGDHITDVFRTEGGTWYHVNGPGKTWEELGPEQMPVGVDRIALADFDGDGIADVVADVFPDVWMISLGGTSSASRFYISHQHLADLPIGNFDDAPGADALRWDDNRLRVVSPSVDEIWSMWEMR